MTRQKQYRTDTEVVHSGIHDWDFNPLAPPIYQSSTFGFEDCDHGADLFAGKRNGFIYSRMGNPTVRSLEQAIASLERGNAALACSSGMAAIFTTFLSLMRSGDHIVCSASVYGATATLLNLLAERFGIEVSFVDTSNINAVKEAFRENTRVVFVETPVNPTMSITDIEVLSNMVHAHGASVVVDNTFMSPVCQTPLTLGADVVVHSMTKYLNGHSDVIAGVIVLKEEQLFPTFRKTLNHHGGTLDPFSSFLVQRGLRTLSLRMERHSANAQAVAEALEHHPLVTSLMYPGLTSHPSHELAKRQMRYMGGMISFELDGGCDAARHLLNKVNLCRLAVSLGGVETLIQHPATMTHSSLSPEARQKAGIGDGLIRLSVGIEDPADIIEDLVQAMETVASPSTR